MLIFTRSSGPTVRGELGTKDSCSSEVPHTNLSCSPLFISSWTLPSSKNFSVSLSLQSSRNSETLSLKFNKKGEKSMKFSSSSSRRRSLCFLPVCRLYDLDFVFLLVAQKSELRACRGLFCHLRNRHSSRLLLSENARADTSRSWKLARGCSSSPQCGDRRTRLIMAFVNQPGRFQQQQQSDFQTGVFDCCSDMSVCLCGSFCLCCLGCSIASDMDECFLCGLGMPIRAVYRTRYNIPGSMCEDYIMTSCCLPCLTCQMKRDINYRKEQGIF